MHIKRVGSCGTQSNSTESKLRALRRFSWATVWSRKGWNKTVNKLYRLLYFSWSWQRRQSENALVAEEFSNTLEQNSASCPINSQLIAFCPDESALRRVNKSFHTKYWSVLQYLHTCTDDCDETRISTRYFVTIVLEQRIIPYCK